MFEKTFESEDLGIKLKSYIDKQQNVWFLGKDVGEILGYSNVRKAIRNHVDSEDKKTVIYSSYQRTQNGDGGTKW